MNVADGWDVRKGHNDLVQLMQLLGTDYKLVMIGLNKRDLAHIPAGITPILRTDSAEELAYYYSRAAWFLNPTYEDTFPTVNLEALACATPVITYRSGGSAEVIDDTCGGVVQPADVRSVAKGILAGSRPSGQVCVERAQKFSREEKYLEYVDLYQQL